MTPQETAEKIVAVFVALDFPARAHDSKQADGEWWVIAGEDKREEVVFGVTAAGVSMLGLRLRLAGSLRAWRRPCSDMAAIATRCQAIVDLMRKDADLRARWAAAQTVADGFKKLGLDASVVSARVCITLDLSPEYAAEVGPKIAAVLAGKKASS